MFFFHEQSGFNRNYRMEALVLKVSCCMTHTYSMSIFWQLIEKLMQAELLFELLQVIAEECMTL